jgi:membrane peptidoglycan carboxypeptidase
LLVCSGLAGVVVAAMAFPIAAITGVAAKAGATSRETLPDELIKRRTPQASEVYAADGTTLISRFFDDDRQDVPLADMAESMRQAIIAAEDQAFPTHHGVDGRAVVRAVVNNWAGRPQQGGSTLTMQYVRLAITYSATNPADIVRATEETKARKIREVGLAQALERRLSKEQILEGYLNMAPFGNGTYGVHTASRLYFGKLPSQLTIAEAATLAGIVKSPTEYNPFERDGATRTRERRDWVIDQMVVTGAITSQQAGEAKSTPLTIKGERRPNSCGAVNPNHWGFFCDYFLRWWMAQDAFGPTPYDRERRLNEGGYRIVTTLDPATQAAAHDRVEKALPTGRRDALMVAAVVPGNGKVRALEANRTFGLSDPAHPNPTSSNPADAANGVRASYPNTTNPLLTGGGDLTGYQAGSTFKIFTVVAALEKGIPLGQTINAKPVYESGYRYAKGPSACPGTDRYCPRNSSASMAGLHDMWSAFGRSVNTFFVPLQEQVGAAEVVDAARRMGIQFRGDDRAMADNRDRANGWGAFTLGVSGTTPLELANAYATLAADGKYCEPIPVEDIRGPDGAVLDVAKPRCQQKVQPDVARAAVDAARCPVGDQSMFGECHGATEPDARKAVGHPVAGKTGTSDSHRTASLAITTRSLTVAGILADPDWPETTADMSHDIVNPAVYQTLADAMKGRPQEDFAKPSTKIAYGDQRAIPSVACEPVDAAVTALRRAGFKVDVDSTPVASSCPADTVARTDPSGRAIMGGTVVIRVSNGAGT